MQKTFAFIRSQLQGLYPEPEIKSFSYLILEFICKKDRQNIWLGKDKQLSSNEWLQIKEIVTELKKYRPIQYIIGETEFYGIKLKVDANVLIPRPETEELVEWIINDFSPTARRVKEVELEEEKELNILDIGTGSGCIAVSLAKHLTSASVYALDISEEALGVARQNAEKNGVDVQFFRHDIFEEWPDYLPQRWSIIVSNPPYVTPEEKTIMSKNILDYEPHQALFVPQEKPLLFYERIASMALTCLKANGNLYFETSSIYGKDVVAMLKSKGFRTVELKQDISGRDRMVRILMR
ncbi:MAG: peptide chain release factor N(5)-glutamine methyltransferase [Dysgonamonadaceae bacterium]|nr:peptide chain release factor N(5)-glutamine methyltransferase [Dysgonamonadaceae bacterium]